MTVPRALRTNLGDHAASIAIKTAPLASDLVAFDFCGPKVANAGFKPMVRDRSFDAGELALGTLLQAKIYGKPIVALPATILSRFQHHYLEYNTAHGELAPKDIEGRRVGVRAYTQTTGIWVRAILQHEYGVDLDRVTWVCTDDPHLAEYRDPANVERIARDSSELGPMLLAGELDAAIAGGDLAQRPGIASLIPDPHRAALDWYAKRGIIPVNHLFVVDAALAEQRPDIVREVYRLLRQAKEAAPRGDGPDLLPFGFDALRPSIDAMIAHAVEQRIIPHPIAAESLFDATTLALAC